MPDFSMCRDEKCPRRKECRRFTAKPDRLFQEYGNFQHETKDGCGHFWACGMASQQERR